MELEMVRTLRSISQLRLVLNKYVLLLICCLATISCDPKAPVFPDVHVWETAEHPETKEMLCGEYKIDDLKNLKFSPIIDHPIQECKGVFGFKAKDFPTVLDWITATEKYYTDKLKECENAKLR